MVVKTRFGGSRSSISWYLPPEVCTVVVVTLPLASAVTSKLMHAAPFLRTVKLHGGVLGLCINVGAASSAVEPSLNVQMVQAEFHLPGVANGWPHGIASAVRG